MSDGSVASPLGLGVWGLVNGVVVALHNMPDINRGVCEFNTVFYIALVSLAG